MIGISTIVYLYILYIVHGNKKVEILKAKLVFKYCIMKWLQENQDCNANLVYYNTMSIRKIWIC